MTHRRVFTILLAAIVSIGQATSARQALQKPDPRSGLLLGSVVDALTGAPVPGAVLQLVRNDRSEPMKIGVVTGSDGQFVFGALPAGRFMLGVQKPGYAPASMGQVRPTGHDEPASFDIKQDERRVNVTVRMWKYTVITGRVVNEAGEPLIGVTVSAFRRIFKAGRLALDAHETRASTDDRGIYRISRLLPGDYVVGMIRHQRAVPASVVDEIKRMEGAGDKTGAERMNSELRRFGTWMDPPGSAGSIRVGSSYLEVEAPAPSLRADGVYVYPSVFYPNASALSAARILSVGAEELPGIDFTVRPIRTVTVSGTLTDGGGAAPHFPVRLVPEGAQAMTGEWTGPQVTTMTDARGRYTFPAVPPGAYTVTAFRGQPAWFEATAIMFGEEGGGAVLSGFEAAPMPEPTVVPTRFGAAEITVADRPVEVPVLPLAPGIKVSGHLTFVGATKPPSAEQLKDLIVVFEAADGRSDSMNFESTGKVDERGQFESVELPPGRYLVRTHRIDGWSIASAMIGGRDASVTPIELGSTAVGGVEIRFTDRPAGVAGAVTGLDRAGDADATLVVLFPVDRAGWVDFGNTPRRLVERAPDASGAFEMTGLPPGDYFITAVTNDGLRDWREPDALERLSRQATRVRLAAGAQQSVSIRVNR